MLELAHDRLYWPEPNQIWEPSGSGPKVYAKLAREKIGEKIKREFGEDAQGLKVSVLAANPQGDSTEAPLAIVCQFGKPISQEIIKETYRLAWSFSRARSLITVEPQLLRVWSCCEPPKDEEDPNPVFRATEDDLVEQAANALQWVELVSGEFFQKYENRFKRSGAADLMLLANLKTVRGQLQKEGLNNETIHDLLARIIFIQFLFQKQDSNGIPALNDQVLEDLHRQGILSKVYRELPEILDNFDDTYNLFRWLNNKFNGDLFPGKGESEEQREDEWQAEIQKVRREDNRYLTTLAEFVRGDLDMGKGQFCLWPQYYFDVIPLDFVSSIYEEFVDKKAGTGVHYTPEYIVDFILDGVLPWNEPEWNLKILDPACGSGIFLVKAFQRLIYRWEIAHNGQRIPGDILRTLLENNIFGIDIDKEAVRVASFSLYLTMLDSIDPSEYWENEVRFPILRDKRLIWADFFEENTPGFRSNLDADTYDLVIGNAPWGKNSITKFAKAWEKRKENKGKWKTSYGNIGTLFLPKAAMLTKHKGYISMMQPVLATLFYQDTNANKFREQLLSEFQIEEIVNLSSLRFELFKKAISPACIITFRKVDPDGKPFAYICPKSVRSSEGDYQLVIEPHDINFIYPKEALRYPLIWAALMWGSRRDFNLMKVLAQYESLAKYEARGLVKTRQGVIPGDRKKHQKEILGRRRLWKAKFPEGTFLKLDPRKLPINEDPYVHSAASTDFSAFEIPQLIVKQSWQSSSKRFQAVLVEPDEQINKGIICSDTCVSVHALEDYADILKTACLIYNSKIAVYYLFLLDASFASERPKVTVANLLSVPLIMTGIVNFDTVKTYDDIDKITNDLFALKDSEYVLIDDLFKYTLSDFKLGNFKGGRSSPRQQKTQRSRRNLLENEQEPELKEYCQYFIRVIKASFGQDKEVCATIFQEESTNDYLPIRLVGIYLNKFIHEGIEIEPINSKVLLDRLHEVNDFFINQNNSDTGGIFYQRVARVYGSTKYQGEYVPTVYLIKPDKIRYWTRSMALQDADQVVADIMTSARNNIQNS